MATGIAVYTAGLFAIGVMVNIAQILFLFAPLVGAFDLT